MDFQEVRRRNAARSQQLKSRQSGMFLKWSNDKDAKLIILGPPYEGFDREIRQKDGSVRTRQHYRMHPLGECNFKTGEGAGASGITPKQIMELSTSMTKIVTAPQSMATGISEAINQGHRVLCIVRNGVANSKDTTYSVLEVVRLQDKELEALTPHVSKTDIEHIERTLEWEDLLPEEVEMLESLGGGNGED